MWEQKLYPTQQAKKSSVDCVKVSSTPQMNLQNITLSTMELSSVICAASVSTPNRLSQSTWTITLTQNGCATSVVKALSIRAAYYNTKGCTTMKLGFIVPTKLVTKALKMLGIITGTQEPTRQEDGTPALNVLIKTRIKEIGTLIWGYTQKRAKKNATNVVIATSRCSLVPKLKDIMKPAVTPNHCKLITCSYVWQDAVVLLFCYIVVLL